MKTIGLEPLDKIEMDNITNIEIKFPGEEAIWIAIPSENPTMKEVIKGAKLILEISHPKSEKKTVRLDHTYF